MNILVILIPVTLFLGLLALGAFIWTVRNKNQYDDPKGHGMRFLSDRYDDEPKQD